MTWIEVKTELRAIRRLEILSDSKSPENRDLRFILQKKQAQLQRLQLQ